MTMVGTTHWPSSHDDASTEPKTLLTELKRRRENKAKFLEGMKAAEQELADLARAIAALEAPAQPLDELRTDPGSVEEVRDQFEASTQELSGDSMTDATDASTLPGGVEESRDHLIDAQTCEEVDPRIEGDCGETEQPELGDFEIIVGEPWPEDPTAVAIAAYIEAENEAPAPKQDASVEAPEPNKLTAMEMNYLLSFCGYREPEPWGAAMSAIMEQLAGRGMIVSESDATPTATGRKLAASFAGIPEPSPYAEAIEKGAITQDEADFLVSERERIAADEQASFFAKGMMADADKHAKHDGPFAWLRKREDA